MSLSVAVAGASGYAGGELLRLIAGHPELEVTIVTAHQNAGQPLASVHPHLRSLAHLELQPTTAEVLSGADIVFLALPHGKSGEVTAGLPDDVLVIDCGADHRLTDPADWAAFYERRLRRRLDLRPAGAAARAAARRSSASCSSGATRIAVPGCNVTAITLGLAPGIAAGVIEPDDLVVGARRRHLGRGQDPAHRPARERDPRLRVGVPGGRHPPAQPRDRAEPRGGGRRRGDHLVHAGARADVARHPRDLDGEAQPRRHAPTTSARPGSPPTPTSRSCTCCPAGAFPRSADAIGANTALIGLAVDERADRVVAVSAIDNLVKGTAGAAIQSANIALGLPETLGLPVNGVAP